METLIPSSVQKDIQELVSIAAKDTHAELEIKVLAGQLQTKDTADRIVKAIEGITLGDSTDQHRATFSYSDGLRVARATLKLGAIGVGPQEAPSGGDR